MKNEKNYLGFLIIKIWHILKRFSRALSWAQTSYFKRVTYLLIIINKNFRNMNGVWKKKGKVRKIKAKKSTWDPKIHYALPDNLKKPRKNPALLRPPTNIANQKHPMAKNSHHQNKQSIKFAQSVAKNLIWLNE